MEFVHVRNLEKFHPGYKDRKLQWAKIYFTMAQGDPDCEMIDNEIDFARLIKFILLELEAQKPIPLDEGYLTRKGFNLKKRPIALTVNMLHNFIELIQTKSETCVLDKDKEKEEDKSKSVVTEQRNEPTPQGIDSVKNFFIDSGSNSLEAEKFFDHFTSNGWKVGGKAPMKDWKASARNWMRNSPNYKPPVKAKVFTCAKCGESYSSSWATHWDNCRANPKNITTRSQATDMLNKLGWEKK